MTRTLAISLITLGDPETLSGGYLYHRRMAAVAPAHGARVEFVSVPEIPFPLAAAAAPAVLRRAVALARARGGGGYRADDDTAGAGDTDGAERGVLLVDSIAAAFLGPWMSLVRPALPLAAVLHQPPGGMDHGPWRQALQARLDVVAYRRARLMIVASEALADDLVAGGIDRRRLRVVPPGRDVAAGTGGVARAGPSGAGPSGAGPSGAGPSGAADVRVELRRGSRVALLCVGNWVPRKGILELLDAVAGLPPGAATLHLVGDPAAGTGYGRRVAARLAGPDLSDRVVTHGPVTAERVAQLYRSADVFVLASTQEPYGTVYGEAMAWGLPVVGWRAGNLAHLAVDQREGLLVAPGDVAALRTALRRLVDDADLRGRLGVAARHRADSLPTWDQSAMAFFAALREAAG